MAWGKANWDISPRRDPSVHNGLRNRELQKVVPVAGQQHKAMGVGKFENRLI
jgi:hypothetical protein